jgi:hypothetical protein
MLVGTALVPWGVLASAPSGGRDPLRLVLGFVAGTFFLLIALLVPTRCYRFDRAQRQLHWGKASLLTKRSGTISFDAIRAAVAQPRMDDDNPRTRRLSYRPVLLTMDGEMPLSNSSSLDADDYSDLLEAVREVVGLDRFDPVGELSDLVRAGRITDAVALLRRRTGTSLVDARREVEKMRRDLAGPDGG